MREFTRVLTDSIIESEGLQFNPCDVRKVVETSVCGGGDGGV